MTLNEPSKQQTHEERTTGKLLTDSYGKNVECELVSEPVRARQIWASPCAHSRLATNQRFGMSFLIRKDAAKIRAFFIHPGWARRGIGSMILKACEDAARSAGFTRYEMGATLTGARLFAAKGYVPVESIEIPLVNGESLRVIHMEKQA